MGNVERVTAYLGLGSNLGCREKNLDRCVRHLTGQDDTAASAEPFKPGNVRPVRSSDTYETEPWGFTGQGHFLNRVLEVSTAVPPQELLGGIKELESRLGREPGERYGPRLIDIDILLYGREIVDLPGLQIPHPRLHQRAFVLVPLAEIAPDLIHPSLGISIGELCGQVEGKDGVRKWSGTIR